MKGKTRDLLLVAGIGAGFYFAWESNFLGIRDFIDTIGQKAQDIFVPKEPYTGGSSPQAVHSGQYSFRYPYPPTQYPMTAAPTTQAAGHYRIAGTPNIMVQGAGILPNPTLWHHQGGISNPRIAMPTSINYGPYRFESPIFSAQRYGVTGTNIDYPFIIGPVGPSPCPVGTYRASDGRCYNFQSPPPEPCASGYYRAADGRCYFAGP
jgi:hypothetical protein